MKKLINRFIFLAIVLMAGAFYLLVQPIVSASRPKWPKITNHGALLSDAQKLIPGNDGKAISSNLWTTSISELKPRYVFGKTDHLEITISTGGIGPSWGYLVFSDKRTSQQSTADVRILKREGAGIYRYETIE